MLRLALVILSALVVACESEPKPPAAVQPATPPDEIQFPTSAAHARYMFYGEEGERVVVGKRSEVPEQLLSSVAVLMGERTKAPAGQLYVLIPGESDDRISVARLGEEKSLQHTAAASWDATYLGISVWEEGMITAQLVDEEPVRKRRSKRAKSGKPTRRTIEIVSLGSDLPADTSSSFRPVANRSWKPVTIFYSPTCGWCKRAMRWMDSNGVKYSKRNVRDDRRANLEWGNALRRANSNSGGVPTFLIGRDRQFMQGWDEDRFVSLAAR